MAVLGPALRARGNGRAGLLGARPTGAAQSTERGERRAERGRRLPWPRRRGGGRGPTAGSGQTATS
jgi:hypothetical protein